MCALRGALGSNSAVSVGSFDSDDPDDRFQE